MSVFTVVTTHVDDYVDVVAAAVIFTPLSLR